MKTDLPTNAWLSPTGEPHPVEKTKHAEVGRRVLEGEAPDDTTDLFDTLFKLGWVRVQRESATRTNIAFHALTKPNQAKVEELVEFLLCSNVAVYVVAPGDSDFIEPGDRKWKAKLRSLNEIPAHWRADEGFGNSHA